MSANWHNIWEAKALEETEDLLKLDGWENTPMKSDVVYSQIKECLKLQQEDTILEVGCGAGALSVFFDRELYTGCDYSANMVARNRSLNATNVRCCHACDLPFPSDSFDCVFAYSVFQYFPSMEYAHKVIREMARVGRRAIYIGDLPITSPRSEHLLYNPTDYTDVWVLSKGYYSQSRFNIWRNL